MSTESRPANLAVRRQHQRIHPQVALRRLRVAFFEIVGQAAKIPDRWYGLTRERNVSYPFEREREFVHEAIQQGATTPLLVLRFRLAQLADDLAQFPDEPRLSDVCYVQLMAEQAEALEAQATARGLATPEARVRAVRETVESITVAQLYVAQEQLQLDTGTVQVIR